MTDYLQPPDFQEWQDFIDSIPSENLDFDDSFFGDLPSQTWSADFDNDAAYSTLNDPSLQSYTPFSCAGRAFTRSTERSPLGGDIALAKSNSNSATRTEPLWELVPETENVWHVPGQFDGDGGVTRHCPTSEWQTLVGRLEAMEQTYVKHF